MSSYFAFASTNTVKLNKLYVIQLKYSILSINLKHKSCIYNGGCNLNTANNEFLVFSRCEPKERLASTTIARSNAQ